jgi:hypothetical protein
MRETRVAVGRGAAEGPQDKRRERSLLSVLHRGAGGVKHEVEEWCRKVDKRLLAIFWRAHSSFPTVESVRRQSRYYCKGSWLRALEPC